MSGQTPIALALAGRLARAVGPKDRARAALHVLDWTGCALAGGRRPPALAMRRALGEGAGRDVFFWGALGNILEMDDVDRRALLHPGPVVVPAALAASELGSVASDAFLDAVVRGYEAMIRVGRSVGPAHYRFWHNTATCGPFGACASAASLFHLDREQTAGALGLAGTQSGGLWQVRHEPQSFAKQLHVARAAHSGLFAAELVAAGFTGLASIFEGPQGFFAATCGGADPLGVVDFDADATWTIHEVSFKPWPACRHAHAAIDAARALRAGGVSHEAIEAGVIRVYRDAVVFCDNPAPADPLSAKFSLQHAAAAAFLSGAPTLEDFEGEGLHRGDLARLRARFAVVEDAELTARYPARFGARLDLQLKDGSQRTAAVDDALGDPENPMSEAALRAKATLLMREGGLSGGDAERLADAALHLGHGGGVMDYLRLLRQGLGA
jgi:2-methylcitrate dehydratase PrpD